MNLLFHFDLMLAHTVGSLELQVSCQYALSSAVPVFPAIFIPVSIVRKIYSDFVLKHSVAIKTLKEINKHYKFADVKSQTIMHRYDNRNYYETISTKDYLTYQLVFIQKSVFEKLNDAESNKKKIEKYKEEINEKCNKREMQAQFF